MNSIMSKVSYLSGLVDGLDVDKNTKEGRILTEIVNVLKDMAVEISDISESQKIVQEYIDAIDEDLAELQEDFYDEDYEFYEDEDDNFIQIECAACGDSVYIDKDIIAKGEEITCPNCHKKIATKNYCCE
ncbi:CD1247 N-terminal domain-containing protein [Clostridium thailandense]|uniref:Zinc ribbon domain-containing protein n=1 Tax=Clostridium thailandense TaxID=2794346 RepID=A0A949U222_9CLOT|nr:CD1247 N-terminal domain-containing protein [Clostridium thailandense]MBV7275053.1 hypothetical protein [Clostridium thailandense]MCH5136567.1 hypothetical protein [Clostridiaceae bacterium UIB06]